MASVLFIADMEEGHLLPTFGLGKKILNRGHSLVYAGIADNEEFVKGHGFDFVPVLQQKYPKGYRSKARLEQLTSGVSPEFHLVDIMINDEFDDIYCRLTPDVVIVSTSLSLEALLIYYKYDVQPIIFTHYLFAQGGPRQEAYLRLTNHSMRDLFGLFRFLETLEPKIVSSAGLARFMEPLDHFTEFVACPRQFELPGVTFRSATHHIGPCIRNEDGKWEQGEFLLEIGKTKKIIFASMGSQSNRYYDSCSTLFGNLITLMSQDDMRNFHLVLSTGFTYEYTGHRPSNVTLLKWAPQLEVLKLADVAIIHGGLGSVKECIYYGVPMIVFPQAHDQPSNAKRVEHHQLGIIGNLETITAEELKSHIHYLVSDASVQESVLKMKTLFHQEEQSAGALELIEEKAFKKAESLQ